VGNVGGDPEQMDGGASILHTSGQALQQMESPLDNHARSIAGAAGDPGLSGAANRFAAAFSASVGDTGTQTVVASQLAANAAKDLINATGGA